MGWISALVAIGTAARGKKSAKRRQRRAEQLQAERDRRADGMENESLALARNADARAQAEFNRYQATMQPLEDAYIRRLSRPVDTNAEAAMAGADVERAVATQRGTMERVMRRRGLRAGDAAVVDADASLGLGAARARAAAMTNARRMGVLRQDQNAAALAGLADRSFSRAQGMRQFADAGLRSVYGGAVSRSRLAAIQAEQAGQDNADAGMALGDTFGKYGVPLLDKLG